eukprot:TRINITY_DN15512_c0_g1_i1.p1 TRINITY_DN15512_c0_g1~~TRINITY_DN15512_c0_g1_i1.p1  ORF type:complete len:314 (+),score=50.63 TRINITY_DN15512_c0_g1_i1:105-1046(+)
MKQRPQRSTLSSSSAASDVYKRQVVSTQSTGGFECRLGIENSGMEWKSLQDVAHSTFVAHRLSPLYHFEISPSALRSYSKDMLGAITYHGRAEDSESASASLTQLEDTGDGCGIGLSVTMPGKPESPLYGVLYGDGSESAEGFAVLPLLLTKGPPDNWQTVLQWLQGRFDCCVMPLRVPPFQLTHLVANWMAAGGSRPIELNYHLSHAGVPGIKNITVTFAADAIQRLRHSIAAAGSPKDTTSERETQLMKALEGHFKEHFQFGLCEARLVRVGCAVAVFSTEGKLKVNDEQSSLKVLNDVASLSSLSPEEPI